MEHIDQAVDVRKGEALDTPMVEAFLRDAIPGLDGALSVRQFPSGASNLTYLITLGERELVLRRPPFGTKPKSGPRHEQGVHDTQGTRSGISLLPPPAGLYRGPRGDGVPVLCHGADSGHCSATRICLHRWD